MKAIILAAGRGSRMEDGTKEKPKCMMKLCGRTLLDYAVSSLKQAGFSVADIGIVTGYLHDEIRITGVRYFHNDNWENTNMFVSLTMAGEWLDKDICIVCYSDIVFGPGVIKLLAKTDSELAISSYTGYRDLWQKRFDNPFDDMETFKQKDGKLVEIGKRPMCNDDVEGQYMGLLRFTPLAWKKTLQSLPASKPTEKLDMTTLLQHLITLGHEIDVLETNELWLECDSKHDIFIYERDHYEELTS